MEKQKSAAKKRDEGRLRDAGGCPGGFNAVRVKPWLCVRARARACVCVRLRGARFFFLPSQRTKWLEFFLCVVVLACFSLPVFPWYAPGTRPVERRESPALSPAASVISYIYGTSAPCHAGGHPKLGGAAARDVGESAGGGDRRSQIRRHPGPVRPPFSSPRPSSSRPACRRQHCIGRPSGLRRRCQ